MTVEERASYEGLMDTWRTFMDRDPPGRGFRSRDSFLQSDGARDFEQLCESVDATVFNAVDACVDSLPRDFRHALYFANGLTLQGAPSPMMLIGAERELLKKLRWNPCTAIKF